MEVGFDVVVLCVVLDRLGGGSPEGDTDEKVEPIIDFSM